MNVALITVEMGMMFTLESTPRALTLTPAPPRPFFPSLQRCKLQQNYRANRNFSLSLL